MKIMRGEHLEERIRGKVVNERNGQVALASPSPVRWRDRGMK